MSNTTTIDNSSSNKNTDDINKAAPFIATGATAAGLGFAAANVVSGLKAPEETREDNEQVVISENEAGGTEVVTEQSFNPEPIAQSVQPEESESITAQDVVTEPEIKIEPEVIIEPEPIVESNTVVETEPATEPEVTVETEPAAEPEVTVETEPAAEPEVQSSHFEESVDPDEIAEAIIAEEEIDPNDIDMYDVINFDEIGTIYTVEGESYTAAAFHDVEGNNLIMVDIDGDNVFDVITDYDGNILADVPIEVTVGDVEEDIEDDTVYLAHDSSDNMDEYGTDSLTEDLLG